MSLEVVKRSDNLAGFKVVPKRWIVERTFGWLLWSRRLNKDYEVLTQAAEALVYVAMIRLMIRRLAEVTLSRGEEESENMHLPCTEGVFYLRPHPFKGKIIPIFGA